MTKSKCCKNKCCDDKVVEEKIVKNKIKLCDNISVGDGTINGINIYRKVFPITFSLNKCESVAYSEYEIKKNFDDAIYQDYTVVLSSIRLEFDTSNSTDYGSCLEVCKIGVCSCDDYFTPSPLCDVYLNDNPDFVYLYRSLSMKPLKKIYDVEDEKMKITFKSKIPENGTVTMNLNVFYLKD